MSHQQKNASIFRLYWQVLRGKYVPHGELSEADSIIGLSFGMRCDPEASICVPDPANYELAQYIEKIFARRPLPRLLQHEIAEDIHGKHELWLTVERPKRHGQQYLDTSEVIRQAQQVLKAHKLNKPIIVAQAYHLPRVDAVARKMGLETVVLPDLPKVWDKESTQIWTRGYLVWIFREALSLALYKLKGYI